MGCISLNNENAKALLFVYLRKKLQIYFYIKIIIFHLISLIQKMMYGMAILKYCGGMNIE